MMTSASGNEQQRSGNPRSAAEWTTLAVMLLIVGSLVGALLWHALTDGEEAVFTVAVDTGAIVQRGDTFQVPFTIQNTGRATAEDVLVNIALTEGDTTIEETELTFRFMGAGERADGMALFSHDPRSYQIDAKATSFLVP